MDHVERLNSLCPVCDGPISFEADRLGEWVNCPHCQDMIALGSVEPLPATSQTVALAHHSRYGIKLLACACAIFLLLAGGVLLSRKVTATQPNPKSHEPEMTANAGEAVPVQPPVELPATAPTPVPATPTPDQVWAEQFRQRQAQLNQQQLIAELRRANDIAEANARWQRWHEMESSQMMNSQPVEIMQSTEVIQPTEIVQPIPAFQVFQTIPPPIRVYGGGIRVGSPVFYNLHSAPGQRVRQNSPLIGNTTYPLSN